MRWLVLLALALAACGAGRPAVPRRTATPVRVMSVNQCADQTVLALLPPERIASVTWLSRDPGTSPMAARARSVGVNHGHVEDVLAQRPDLVIAGAYTTPALRGMLRRVGYPMLEVGDPGDLAAVRRVTREIAVAVGERARGEALLARMDTRLAALARAPAPPIRVVAWDRSGFAAGAGTLLDTLLNAAGAVNVARDEPSRRPDVERLLRLAPALLVQGAPYAASLGDDVSGHRLIRRVWRGRMLTVPQADYLCGTPLLADAALRLRARLHPAATAGGRR